MTSANLRGKYGPPSHVAEDSGLVHEVFTVRPNIGATVIYGRDARACVLTLSRMGSHESLDDTVLDTLINELAPPAMRGSKKGEGSHMDGSAGSRMILFDNVAIDRVIFSNPGPNFPEKPSATIRFLRTGCPSRP